MSALDRKTIVTLAVSAVAILMLVSAGVAYYGHSASLRELGEQEQRLGLLQQQLDRALDQTVLLPAVKPQRWQLCSGPEVVTTMQVVQGLADQAAVLLDGLTAMRAADSSKQAFEVKGHGHPDAVCAFVAAVEQDARLMIFETGRVMPAPGGEIAFQFGLATYYQLEAK